MLFCPLAADLFGTKVSELVLFVDLEEEKEEGEAESAPFNNKGRTRTSPHNNRVAVQIRTKNKVSFLLSIIVSRGIRFGC